MEPKEIETTKQRVDAYLHRTGMHADDADFSRILENFQNEMAEGLSGQKSSLAMIPTYIEAEEEVPIETPVLVLDAGGTNFRTAILTFASDGSPRIDQYFKYPMPGTSGHVERDEFFDIIAEKISKLYDAASRIGFCFSYPTEISPDKDGKLLHFSKEIQAPGVEGEYVRYQLTQALARAGLPEDAHIVVLNDTVATLLAAKTAGSMEHFDTYLGFILGTGLNCAYVERNSRIGKLSGLDPERSQIINMESGGFDGFTGGEIDDEFDASTKSPGYYRLEKMVSGAYLGPLAVAVLKRAARDGQFSPEAAERIERLGEGTTIEMDEFLHAPATAASAARLGGEVGEGAKPHEGGRLRRIADVCVNEEERLTAFLLIDNVVERAGKLAALNLTAAVLQSGVGTDPTRPAAICADGTTFYKTHRLKFYTEYYLKKELEERRGRYAQLIGLDNAPVIGAAVAGLTN